MRTFIVILIVFIFCLRVNAQKFLAVDLYRLGTFTRIKVYEGTKMKFKIKGDHRAQKGTLTFMKDSLLIFNDSIRVKTNELKFIVVDKSHILLKLLRRVLIISGVGFVAIDSFNNAINNDSPVFKERVLVIGGSLFIAGQLLKLTETKRVRPGNNRRLHIIDMNFD